MKQKNINFNTVDEYVKHIKEYLYSIRPDPNIEYNAIEYIARNNLHRLLIILKKDSNIASKYDLMIINEINKHATTLFITEKEAILKIYNSRK